MRQRGLFFKACFIKFQVFLKYYLFGIKPKKNNDLIPKGIHHSVIPSIFIDGNKNPIWKTL